MPIDFGEKNVNNLSGPVSMHIYIPNDIYLKNFPYAPILILFGDVHESNIGECIIGEKIYDEKFLKLISDAVAGDPEKKENYDDTIDFYIEGGDFHNSLDTPLYTNKFPMEQLWNLFLKCYSNSRMKDRKISDENKSTCDLIKNIRWQSGDIRFFKKEDKKFNSSMFLNKIYDRMQVILTNSSPEKDYYKEEDRKYNAFRESCIYYIGVFKEIYNNPIQDLSNMSLDADKLYNKYVIDSEGLIFKQLKKIKEYGGDDVTLSTKFKSYMETIDKGALSYDFQKRYVTEFHSFITTIFTHDKFSKEFEEEVRKFSRKKEDATIYTSYLRILRSTLLELYSWSRIYKTMIKSMRIQPNERKDNNEAIHPLITICYFGDQHICNMTSYLLEENNYEKYPFSKATYSYTDRCLMFDRKYNLKSLINQVKDKRKLYEAGIKKS